MSIYATIFTIGIEDRSKPGHFFEVTAQGVPPHIGRADGDYEVDLYASFLPPVVKGNKYNRAVVFIGPDHRKGTKRNGQEYVNPLFTITGKEYAKAKFGDLLSRIAIELKNQGYKGV